MLIRISPDRSHGFQDLVLPSIAALARRQTQFTIGARINDPNRSHHWCRKHIQILTYEPPLLAAQSGHWSDAIAAAERIVADLPEIDQFSAIKSRILASIAIATIFSYGIPDR